MATANPSTRATTGTNKSPEIAQRKDSIWNREIEFSKPFSGKEKQLFFHLLSVLMESGLSITESLDVIIGQMRKKKSQAIVQTLVTALHEGHALSDAVARQPEHFDKFETYSLRMGERSGQMAQVLEDLATYHEKRQKLQRKFVQALSYPAVVITIAGGVLFFMIQYVVPMFSDIFLRFDAELPQITQIVIAFSEFSKAYAWYIIGILAILVGIVLKFKSHPAVLRWSSTIFAKIPILGGIILKIQMSRFCYSLALMLRSKVSLDQALELMDQLVQYYPIQRTIAQIRTEVVQGKTFYEALSVHKIFPSMVCQMIKVGERTAKLDKMIHNVAKNLEEEGEAGITTLTTLLEPLLIVVLGLLVGIILISMYLPMFELSNTING
jgi:type IV pilus assembly protein PilC